MPIRACSLLLCGWLAAAAPAFAGTHTVTLYADLGNDPGSGCTATTGAGSFSGAELALDTTFVTDASGAQVTRVELRLCGSGGFGPPQLVDPGSWPVGLGNGDGGSAAIEAYLPLSALGGASVARVGIFSAAGGGGNDALLMAPGGGPILLLLGAAEIPTLSGVLLLLLTALLGFAGWRALRLGRLALVVAILLLGSSAVLFAAVIRDGQTSDWAGQALRGIDTAGDAPVNADLLSFYAQVEGPLLFLRIDADIQPDAIGGQNQAPRVNAGPDVLTTLDQTPALAGSVSDDGLPSGTLSLLWTQVSGPGTTTFGSPAASTTTASFTATGSYVLRLTADDGELSANDEVTVHVDVAAANVAPTLDPVPDRAVGPNMTLSLGLVGRDANPFDTLTYSLVSGPDGAAVTPRGIFAFTPTPAQLGSHSITVQVTDPGGLSAGATFQVTVAAGNHPPALDPLADAVASTGASWTRGVTASDPDPGDPLTFVLLSGPAGMTLSGRQLSWTPAPEQTGAFPVRLEVSDAAGASAEGTFTVSVPLPGAPVAYDDRYEVRRGETLDVSAPGVLANDVEPGGGALAATRLGDPDKGALTAFGSDGSFTYEAPAAEPPPPPLDVELRTDWTVANLVNGPLIGDFDGDGGSDTVVFAQHSQILFLRPDGSVLALHDGLLPAPYGDCTVDAPPGQGLLADVDDDGKVELVTLANCKRDYPDGPRIYGAAHRLIAFSYQPPAGAGPGGLAVDWLSPLVAVDAAAANDALRYVKLTAARLAPSEPPSILWGVERAPYTASCGTLIPGTGDAHCRVVTVHRGSDGAILRRFYDVPANPNGWAFTLISGKSAPIAADLDADGVSEVVYNGTIWEGGGAVRARLDGLPGPHLPIVDAAVADLDGDGTPEILGLSTQWAHEAGYLRAFRADGTLLWHFAVYRSTVQSSLSVADVDRDGSPEALFSVWSDLFVVDSRGRLKWLRSFADGSTATIAHGSQPARYPVYDLDGDGLPEVVVQDGAHDVVFLRGDNGEEQARWHAPGRPRGSLSLSAQAPTVADLDGDGAAEVLFLLNANDGNPPRVITLRGVTPWRAAPRAYHGRGALGAEVAEDGSVPPAPPAFWKDPATNRFDQPAPRPYTVDPRLRARTSFPYRASSAHHDAPPATVTIDLVPDNRPPVVTSTPPASARRSSIGPSTPLTYQITAVDPDAGDVLSYQLVLAGCGTPGAASVDAATGLFRYAAAANDETCTFGVRLSDGQGGSTYHGFAVTFTEETRTVPNLVGQPETHALTVIAAAELTGGRVSRRTSPAPAGEVIEQTPPAGASALRNSAVDFVVSTGPAPEDRDDDGDGTSESQGDCDDTAPAIHPGAIEIPGNGIDENCDGTERNVAELLVEPGAATRAVGEEVAFTATAVYDDGTAGNVTASATWSSSAPGVASLDTAGRARALSPGGTTITASFGGVTGRASLAVRNRNAGDQEAPTALILAPADGGAVTNPAQVIGTASDTNLLRWELAVAPTGEDAFTQVAEGTAPITDGLLGTFDPTLLLNGIYRLRLMVWDTNGNTASDEVAVQVEGDQKVGVFTLAFDDLTVPVSGISVQAVRSYDSRDKQQGDFGIGWRLGVNTLRISSNRVLGRGWQVSKPGLAFGLAPESSHFVSVTHPDGRVEQFDLVIEPAASFLVPLSSVRARFSPRPGAQGTLESLDNNDLRIVDPQPGPVALLDDATLQTYDPQLFRYTTPDGTQIEIHRTEGTRRITDTHGNGLTFTASGIFHSAGKSILLTRDGQGRIHQITDPMGQSQLYAYDADGNLASHTDAAGNTTRFFYNRRHDLIRIVDPLNRTATRNDYDEQGRLVAVTDAKGNRVEITHDLAARRELVRDRLGRWTIYGYDERGNLLSETNALGATTRFTYDGAGNLLSQTNPLGHTTRFTYDADNRLTSFTDPLGRTSRFTYDSRGRISTVTDPLGRTRASAYDAGGNLIRQTDALGNTTSFSHDAAGNLLSNTDALNHGWRNEYDPAGRRTRLVDALGSVTAMTYDGNGNLLTQSEGAGASWSLTYDGVNRPTRLSFGGRTQTVIHDPAGQITGATTATGQSVAFTHDASGLLTQFTGPDGGAVVSRTYDAEGNVLSQTDDLGKVTRYEYDGVNRLIATTSPDGSVARRAYDAADQLIAATDGLGRTTRFEYDAGGQLIRMTDPLGGVSTREYDAAGNLIVATDPLGRTTRYTYDAEDRLITTTLPGGVALRMGYDAAGRVTEATDPAGNTTAFSYDALGRLTSVLDALGHRTSYEYNPAGLRSAIVDANGHRTSFTYDDHGRLLTTVYAGGGTESRTYDVASRLTSSTNGNGETVHYEYTPRGRLSGLRLPGGEREIYSHTIDGLVSRVTDARGTTAVDYEPVTRRLARITEPDGRYIRYAYDAAGNLTMMAHAMVNGGPEEVTGYAYDALNRLTAVTDPNGGVTRYTYDGAGNPTSIARPNGTVTTLTYDDRNRLTSLTHRDAVGNVLHSETYTLDPLGNRTAVRHADNSRVEYRYDALSRLTAESHFDANGALTGSLTYDYDAVGNLVARNGTLGNATFTYNANNQLIAGNGSTYVYDGEGNLTSETDAAGGNTRYTYDARGRLVRLVPPSGGTTTYTYDWRGIRTSKSGPGGTIHYLVAPENATGFAQVLRESDAAGTTLRSYVYGSQLLMQIAGGAASYYHADGLGSTRMLTNQVGAPTDTYEYSGYGVLLARTGASPNVYRFAGEQQDVESGLYYLRARYYQPAVGRFLSRDPAAGSERIPLSLHEYLYAHANPANFTDPSGRSLTEVMFDLTLRSMYIAARMARFGWLLHRASDVTGEILEKAAIFLTIMAAVESLAQPAFAEAYYGDPPASMVGPVVALGVAFDMWRRDTDYEWWAWCGEYGLACVNISDRTATSPNPKYSPPPPSRKAYINLTEDFVKLPPLPTILSVIGSGSMPGVLLHEYVHITLRAPDFVNASGCIGAGFLTTLSRKIRNKAQEDSRSVVRVGGGLIAGAIPLWSPENHRCFVESSAVGIPLLGER